MTPFTLLSARAAPLPIANVDTDMIIPKQFLKTIKRTGLGVNLFHEMRFDMEGNEIADFILNQAPYRQAEILISEENFGCGSSREHAPWALLDFGIRCVIAPSFADIFYNNCFKNGILPVVLPKEQVSTLLDYATNTENTITVDLESQQIRADNQQYSFEIDPFRKRCVLEGLDDIALTLEHEDKITAFEATHHTRVPWLFNASA